MKKNVLIMRSLFLIILATLMLSMVGALTACSSSVYFNESNPEPGLYDETGKLIAPWNELVNEYAICKKGEKSLENITEILESHRKLSKGATLVIAEGVEEIGANAFTNCKQLKNILIPNSLSKIGEWAFSGCDSLEYNEYDNAYYLGNSTNPYVVLVEAKDEFIETCEINPITKIIYTTAFIDCLNLREINVPNSITDIGESSFSGCSALERISISGSITTIGSYAFADCNALSYNTYDNAYYLGNETNPFLILVKTKDTNITICEIHPETKLIYHKAFSECTHIRQIDIPNSVSFIGQGAFSYCNQLSSITIPDAITRIEDDLFVGCNSLVDISIPNSVTQIGKYAFNGCSSLTNVVIPNSVTNIEQAAFHSCTSLSDIALSENIISIGQAAFYECTSLTSIVLPNKLEAIQQGTFAGCDNLTSITIPNSVTHIAPVAFDRCRRLTNVSFIGTKKQWSNISLDYDWKNNNSVSTIDCLDGTIE